MNEENEKKTNTKELKEEASNTVNQVKDTIKKVDIKKDSIETKGFIGAILKDPLGKIQDIVAKNSGDYFKCAIIIIALWSISELIHKCFSLNTIWGYSHIGSSILSIIIATITPILMILIMSFIIFFVNTKNKKSLTTIITSITTANIPIVISSIIGLLTIVSSQISILIRPFSSLCYVITIILTYFSTKSIFGTEKNSEFIKKFIEIEIFYYIAYIILSFLGIYI